MRIFRRPYSYDVDAVSERSALRCEDESLAVQSQRDEADINVLVKRFGVTGMLPQRVRPPIEADFVDIMDYRSALDAVRAADDAFMKLPPDVRVRFGGDPGQFVEFCMNPKNLDEMRKMGLAIPGETVENPPVGVAVATGSGSS